MGPALPIALAAVALGNVAQVLLKESDRGPVEKTAAPPEDPFFLQWLGQDWYPFAVLAACVLIAGSFILLCHLADKRPKK